MTEIELNEKASEIRNLFGEETISDKEIILRIKDIERKKKRAVVDSVHCQLSL